MHRSIRALRCSRWLVAAGMAAATLLPAVPARAVPAGLPQFLVIGRLINACTNGAIGDGSVRLTSLSDPTAVESTDGGHFMFTGLSAGDYLLTATSSGFGDGSVRLLLPAVQDQTGAVDHVDLSLFPSGGPCAGG